MRKLLSYAPLASLVLLALACSSTQSAPARPEGQHPESPSGADESVTRPIVIQRVEPDATKFSHVHRKAGTVLLEALVEADGSVSEVRVVKSLHPEIDPVAADAVRQWRFRPGTRKGQPVPVHYVLSINIFAN